MESGPSKVDLPKLQIACRQLLIAQSASALDCSSYRPSGLLELATFGVGSSERSNLDRHPFTTEFAGALGQADCLRPIPHSSVCIRRQYPREVVQRNRRIWIQSECSVVLINGIRN